MKVESIVNIEVVQKNIQDFFLYIEERITFKDAKGDPCAKSYRVKNYEDKKSLQKMLDVIRADSETFTAITNEIIETSSKINLMLRDAKDHLDMETRKRMLKMLEGNQFPKNADKELKIMLAQKDLENLRRDVFILEKWVLRLEDLKKIVYNLQKEMKDARKDILGNIVTGKQIGRAHV